MAAVEAAVLADLVVLATLLAVETVLAATLALLDKLVVLELAAEELLLSVKLDEVALDELELAVETLLLLVLDVLVALVVLVSLAELASEALSSLLELSDEDSELLFDRTRCCRRRIRPRAGTTSGTTCRIATSIRRNRICMRY